MARLINDSGVLGDTMTVTAETVNQVSFDKIIEAIHVVQDRFGIAGATADEAATTIEGSVNSAKAAWTNLVTGVANDSADLDKLVDNFITSADTAAKNVLPRIEKILTGLGSAVEKVAPILAEQIPAMASQVLPSMVSAGSTLLVGLVQGLIIAAPELLSAVPGIVQSVVTSFQSAAPSMVSAGQQLLTMLGSGIMQGIPLLAQSAVSIMSSLGSYLSANLPTLMQRGLEAVVALSGSLRENAGLIVDGALSLALSLAQGLADSIPTIVENVPTIVTNIAGVINDNAPKVFGAAVQLIGTLVKGLISAIPTIIQNLPQIINAIVNVFLAFNWLNLGKNIITGLSNGIKSMVSSVKNVANQVVDAIKGGISGLPSKMVTIGKNIVQGLWNGIKGMGSWLTSQVKNFFGGIVSGVKNFLGIHSPSTVFAEIGEYSAEGVGVGWDARFGKVKKTIEDGLDFTAPDPSGGGAFPGISGRSGGRFGGVSYGNVTFNIYAREGQDPKEIAQAVAELLQMDLERRENAFA